MYIKILRYFSGYVHFKGDGVFFERFLNLISQKNLGIWDINLKENTIEGFCTLKDFNQVKSIASKLDINLYDITKYGFPLKLQQLKYRIGLVLGLVCFAVCIFLFNNFIWDIEIVDYDEQKASFLLEEINSLGVKKGALINSLDLRWVQQELLIRFENLSWIALNREGTKITVMLAEKEDAPDIDSTDPCDIIANKTGIVTYMEVYAGQSVVKLRDVVLAGELLVSGEVTTISSVANPDGSFPSQTRFVHSDAKIIAQTISSHTISFSYNQTEKKQLNQTATRKFLDVFGLKIPLFIAFDFEYQFDESIAYYPFEVFENKLPLGIYEKTYSFYELEDKTYTRDEALAILNESFSAYEKEKMQDIKILSFFDSVVENEDSITIEREYTCEENIAKKSTENK